MLQDEGEGGGEGEVKVEVKVEVKAEEKVEERWSEGECMCMSVHCNYSQNLINFLLWTWICHVQMLHVPYKHILVHPSKGVA